MIINLFSIFFSTLATLPLFFNCSVITQTSQINKIDYLQHDNDSSEEQLYEVTFFTFRRGNSIGRSHFKLFNNGFFEIDIGKEKLEISNGTYSIDGAVFKASTKFSMNRKKTYYYVLKFKGISIFKTYFAGTAKLVESIEKNKVIQKLPFLFFASKKTVDIKKK